MNFVEREILRREAMKFLKKYWPTIMSVGGAAVTFLLPAIQVYAATHPKTIVGVLLGAVITAYHSSAPKDQNLLAK
jgi:hypothetical protein